MKKEVRTVCFDEELKIEAYRFEGIDKPFPNHFHEHYVIGFIEKGERTLSCKNKEYLLREGDVLLFNPGDNHACVQCGRENLDYRGLNIPQDVMRALTEEITGQSYLPGFTDSVIQDEEATFFLRSLHRMITEGSSEFGKEEALLFLLEALILHHSRPFEGSPAECRDEIEKACAFMEERYAEQISLDQIGKYVGLSKSTLLRAFTKSKGITPYRYLETIRINQARKLLEQGASPVDAALRTGFSDQSHFTNYFSMFTGIAPGVYRSIFTDRNPGKITDRGGKQRGGRLIWKTNVRQAICARF